MKRQDRLVERMPEAMAGMKIEKWLRSDVIKSMASMRFLPNSQGEIVDAINKLEDEKRSRFIVLLIGAQTRVAAQSDFCGVIGIPVFLGLIAIFATFEDAAELLVLYIAAILMYLIIYFYYRLMQAALDSILNALRIPAEYFPPK